jgi:hypothetical protein
VAVAVSGAFRSRRLHTRDYAFGLFGQVGLAAIPL